MNINTITFKVKGNLTPQDIEIIVNDIKTLLLSPRWYDYDYKLHSLSVTQDQPQSTPDVIQTTSE